MKLQNSAKTIKKQFFAALFAAAIMTFGVLTNASGQTLDAFNPNADLPVSDIEVLTDGKILIAGQFSRVGGQAARSIARLNADGTLDPTFQIPTIFGPILDIVVQTDGKILIAGSFDIVNGVSRVRVARLNADGTLDTTFDAGFTTPISVGRIALQPDGKILVPTSGSSGQSIVRRRNADGSADSSFVSPVANSSIAQVVLQSDGKVIAVGVFSQAGFEARQGIFRMNSNGTLDSAYNPAPNGAVFLATLAPDGKVYAGGSFTTMGGQPRTYFARLNIDGTVDMSFQNPMIAGTVNVAVRPSVVQPDGKVVIAGTFTTVGGVARFQLARLNPDGTLDTSFRDMMVGVDSSSSPSIIKRQTDGKILIGGGFTTIDGQTRNRIARITPADAPTVGKTRFDFDGDRRADLSVFRPSIGTWFIRAPNGAANQFSFGGASDELIAADYDGDGRTDIAVRSSDPSGDGKTVFRIIRSSNGTFVNQRFGRVGDNASVIGDWDGDGADDYAVYRDGSLMGGQSFFFYYPSSNTTGNPITDFISIPWGAPGDLPMRGDFDGDGRQDPAVFRPSNNVWYILQSSNGQLRVDRWGLSTDKFVPADYDGDQRTDLAVFRNGIWYILQSSNSQPRYEIFGFATDRLVPADYDGDGRTDVAVFRDGIWYLQQSMRGFESFVFGTTTDRPVPERF